MGSDDRPIIKISIMCYHVITPTGSIIWESVNILFIWYLYIIIECFSFLLLLEINPKFWYVTVCLLALCFLWIVTTYFKLRDHIFMFLVSVFFMKLLTSLCFVLIVKDKMALPVSESQKHSYFKILFSISTKCSYFNKESQQKEEER